MEGLRDLGAGGSDAGVSAVPRGAEGGCRQTSGLVSVSHEPLITTILPTFRRPTLLKRAVLSALNQSFPDFTVQILDNASGDETEDVARSLMRQDSRIRYARQPQNIGAVGNIISGIEGVQTRYFNILCDDDALMPR